MNRAVKNSPRGRTSAVLIAILVLTSWSQTNAEGGLVLPDPVVDSPLATKKGSQTAVVADGCFWGVLDVFQHVKGVNNATSGYSGGAVPSPRI